MKKTLLYIFSLLTLSLSAQDGINYQGAATDANGYELTNQSISIRASVLSASASGNLQWEETHSATTDQFGLFNVVIGQGTNTTNGAIANFDDTDWGSGNHFLKIEMDATGGTNYAMIGTTQMMAVPYALYAKSAGIDSTMLANMIAASGGNVAICDIEFPAGLDGVAITHDVSSSNYTVPSGRMLYILDFKLTVGSNLYIDGLKFNNITANKARICNSGQVVSGGGNFNGLLVDEISDVIGITQYLGNYTVPSGKMLYILDFWYYNGDLSIDGLVLNNEARIKIAKGGQVISGGGNLNGYLVDENYFANCGGGSSSATSNATIDSLSQVVSNLDSSLTALTSLFTFGCTDSLAFNYNPNANVDDYSCVAIIYGCTDSTAFNYNTLANTDDGSCILSLVIGINYQGGIIFYLDGNGGGLIAYPWNISNSAQWGCYGTFIGGTGWAIGTGNQNTINIEAGCTTSGTAADLCANLIINGYSDWFLPSMDELNEMYLNIGQGNALGLGNIGGFYNNEYCSSTENGGHQAYVFDFTNGNNYGGAQKYENFHVRAIREF